MGAVDPETKTPASLLTPLLMGKQDAIQPVTSIEAPINTSGTVTLFNFIKVAERVRLIDHVDPGRYKKLYW